VMEHLELGSLDILLCCVPQLVNNEGGIVECGSSWKLLHPPAAQVFNQCSLPDYGV
jgi:hypothetical protein